MPNGLLIVLVVLLVVGLLPTWPYSREWGPAPSIVGVIVAILLIVYLFGGRF